MSLHHSVGINTQGLVFHYDMNNTKKSWRGEPVTNQFVCPDPYDSNNNVGFNVQGTGTFQRVYSGTYGGYDIKPTDVVYRYNLGGSGCHYHGNSAAISAGQYVCYSVDYYISPDASDYPTNNSLVVLENYGGGALGGGTVTSSSSTVMGKWQTIQGYNGPTSSSGTQAMFMYPGGCGSTYMASRGFLLMKNPMFEFRSNVKYNPFVKGTRTSTQSLLDLTGNYTLTASNITYNSDGSFEFNGSNSCYDLNTTSLISGTQDFTIEAVYNATSGSGGREIIGNYGAGYTSNSIWFATHGFWLNGGVGYHSGGQLVGMNCTAVTRNGSTITTYKNGNVDVTGSTSASVVSNINWRIGKDVNGDGEPFAGKIYSIKVYNRALSSAEIKQNFNAQRSIYGL